jgi:indole-3-glycerol phosphate synthase
VNKLEEIIAHKREEIRPILPLADKLRSSALLRNEFRSLEAALTRDPESLAVIAEVKGASPSAGIIREDFDPLHVARVYEEAGASALSVLTDEKYFRGQLSYLTRIAAVAGIPLLRKDFIVHAAQIAEAVVAGADAILLIVAALEQEDLLRLLDEAQTLQLEVLVEVHDRWELDRALETDARIIGINNRNLKTMEVDLATTEELAAEVPEDVVLVSESGLRTAEDASRAGAAGADAILVGESLMRADDVAAQLKTLMTSRYSSAR